MFYRKVIFFFCFLGLALISQQYRCVKSQKVVLADQLKYLPSGTFLKGAALSYDSLLADLLWIKAVTYFGEQYAAGGDYGWLYHILDTATTLDPFFEDIYEFGGIVLAGEVGDVAKSTLLLKKGMENVPRHHPRYWYLPFFLGFNAWYYNNDFKAGARYLEIASRFPGTPSYLPLLVARMYADASSAELALPFLDEMIKRAKTPKRRAELEQRRREVIVNRDLDFLDHAVEVYRKRFGVFPITLEELVAKGIIAKIPEEPFGGKYLYDPLLRKVFSNLSKRIKVHERKAFH